MIAIHKPTRDATQSTDLECLVEHLSHRQQDQTKTRKSKPANERKRANGLVKQTAQTIMQTTACSSKRTNKPATHSFTKRTNETLSSIKRTKTNTLIKRSNKRTK